ncbi:hypothetical protein [Qipengyuania oceanensis]|uniref:DUF3883 domain-containing protein n=1 Tax=Qipengyuania oceanensis TaxID=1463597 RepID=A0A844YKQ3_9SPHN|nr:hypothetical protein [Qipengyuania oceanensis]MXO63949.1 hypothetical protein [Qipengyuania oceanensis]
MAARDMTPGSKTVDETHVSPNRSAALFATEGSAREWLCRADPRVRIPTSSQRRALMISFAERGIALVASAFEAVRLDGEVDLDDSSDITAHADGVTLIEIKSTNQAKIGADLAGYFFNITAAELLTAQTLGEHHRFAFVNTARGEWQELGIRDILAKAKAMYPAFHIRF